MTPSRCRAQLRKQRYPYPFPLPFWAASVCNQRMLMIVIQFMWHNWLKQSINPIQAIQPISTRFHKSIIINPTNGNVHVNESIRGLSLSQSRRVPAARPSWSSPAARPWSPCCADLHWDRVSGLSSYPRHWPWAKRRKSVTIDQLQIKIQGNHL